MYSLIIDYGSGALVTYACFFFLTKGFAGGILKGVALPYFQEFFHVSLNEYHRLYTGVLLLPFCLKPVFGILSDYLPIRGARKRWYIVAAMFTSSVGVCLLLDASFETAVKAYTAATVGIVCADLLFEASYAEQLREKAVVSGNNIVTLCWTGITAGAAIAAIAAGTLADKGMFTVAFALALVGPLATLSTVACGLLPEKPSTRKSFTGIGSIVLGLTVACAAISLLAVVDTGDADGTAAAAVVFSIIVFAVASAVQDRVLVCANLYLFLVEAINVNFVGATDYFYTSRCGNNPDFDYTFYVTYTMLLGSIFGLFGVIGFKYVEHWPLKNLFATLAMVRVLLAAVEVVQAARWNVGYIDDHTFFVFGEAILQPVVSMMFFMPMVILTSKLVQKDLEAVTYAILAGTQNFGGLVGAAFGAYFTSRYNISDCSFEALPLALVVGHMSMPLLLVPMAYLLLPDLSMKPKRKT